MRNPGRHLLFWGGLAAGGLVLHWFFVNIIRMPIGSFIVAALAITWFTPRPWRFVLFLAAAGEAVAITPPGAAAGAALAPLLIFWLRGRIQVDISFSYAVLIAASAALSLALAVGAAVYPQWHTIPWTTVLAAWAAITLATGGGSLLIPGLHGRFLHGRYF